MRKIVFLLSLIVSNQLVAETLEIKAKGLSEPESVLYFPAENIYLVTNSHGDPFTKDNNGFISRVTPEGIIEKVKWIAGGQSGVRMNAPKAMELVGEMLYVTDIDVIRVFSLRTRAQQADIKIPGSTHLTGISSLPNGDLLVVDSGESHGHIPTGQDALYRINEYQEITALHSDPEWGTPTGVASNDKNQIFTITYGSGILTQMNQKGVIEKQTTLPGVFLQSLQMDANEEILISSGLGNIYRLKQSGDFSTVLSGLKKPMDMGFDHHRNRLLIPQKSSNTLIFHDLK